jgi:phosphate transport system substrate-binding protein
MAASQVTGAGSTFVSPILSKWIDAYNKSHPAAQITYQAIGSGLGIRYAIEGKADFGASDGPMNDEQIAEFKEKRGDNVLHFPTVLGADVPSYNVPGVTEELNFTPDALAGIFLGRITRWNDPELVKANPRAKLPADKIVVVHRSDGSGTTYVWTDYLSKISGEWKPQIGTATSVNWPVGLGAQGNAGVSELIHETAYSIGYVELIYALQHKLPYGRVRNSSGAFVKAGIASIVAAAAAAATNMPDDFRVSISDPPGKTAYPISSFSWLLIPDKIPDHVKKAVIIDFLKWMLTQGQNMTESLSYGRLPHQVVARELKAIAKIQ